MSSYLGSKRLLLVLRLLAACISAIGGGLALFGESRSADHLTGLGQAALALILAGFVIAGVIEYLEFRSSEESEARERHAAVVRHDWDLISADRIREVSVRYKQREETPVREFLARMTGLSFGFSTLSADRNLTIVEIVGPDSFQERFVFAAMERDSILSASKGVHLWRRSTPKEIAEMAEGPSTPGAASARSGFSPNEESAKKASYTSVVQVEAVQMVFGNRGYISSCRDHWLKESDLACGLGAELMWASLEIDERLPTLKSLVSLSTFRIRIPSDLNLRLCDEFAVSFSTEGGLSISLDLRPLHFSLSEKGCWETSFRGAELYSRLRETFSAERGV